MMFEVFIYNLFYSKLCKKLFSVLNYFDMSHSSPTYLMAKLASYYAKDFIYTTIDKKRFDSFVDFCHSPDIFIAFKCDNNNILETDDTYYETNTVDGNTYKCLKEKLTVIVTLDEGKKVAKTGHPFADHADFIIIRASEVC
jgi:hypothetical protein